MPLQIVYKALVTLMLIFSDIPHGVCRPSQYISVRLLSLLLRRGCFQDMIQLRCVLLLDMLKSHCGDQQKQSEHFPRPTQTALV